MEKIKEYEDERIIDKVNVLSEVEEYEEEGEEGKIEEGKKEKKKVVNTLILVDGTWQQAKNLLKTATKEIIELNLKKKLLLCHLNKCGEGKFIFRREPVKGFISTLEALGIYGNLYIIFI